MKLACSTIHYHAAGWPLDRTLRDIADAGFDGVEINLGMRYSPELLAEGSAARAVLEETGLEVATLMASLFWLGDRSEMAANRCIAEQVLACAADLGVANVLTATGPWPDEMDKAEANEQLLGNLHWLVEAAPSGVAVAIESVGVPWPHSHWPIYNVDSFHAYRAEVGPELKANYDTNNFLTAGDDPVEAVHRLGDVIVGVHLKDARFGDGRYRNVQAGQGVIDFAAALAALREIGYDGWIVAEDETWTTTLEHDPERVARETRDVYRPLLAAAAENA